MKPQTDRRRGRESLDKGEKFPFPPLRRFIRSAVGLWEGPPLLVCFSLLLLRTFTSIHQLSSPSIHPLPPFYDLFFWGFCSVHPDLYSPPPPFSSRLWHTLCLYSSRFRSSPSFFQSPPLSFCGELARR